MDYAETHKLIMTLQVTDLGYWAPVCPEQQLSQSPIMPVVP